MRANGLWAAALQCMLGTLVVVAPCSADSRRGALFSDGSSSADCEIAITDALQAILDARLACKKAETWCEKYRACDSLRDSCGTPDTKERCEKFNACSATHPDGKEKCAYYWDPSDGGSCEIALPASEHCPMFIIPGLESSACLIPELLSENADENCEQKIKLAEELLEALAVNCPLYDPNLPELLPRYKKCPFTR